MSTVVEVPTVIGWLRSIILIPASVLTSLTPRQLEAILAHELAHIRRHDYVVNLIQTAIETVLFYHPAVWWLSKLIREEREHCFDDIAVAISGKRVYYVRALATLEELRSSPTFTLAADGGSLLQRIRRLSLGSTPDARRSTRWGASLIVLAVVAAFGNVAAQSSAIDDLVISPTGRKLAEKDGEAKAALTEPAKKEMQIDKTRSTEATNQSESSSDTIIGTIVTPDGKPAAGVSVVVFEGETLLTATFISDERGQVRVPKIWRSADHFLSLVARRGREEIGWFDFFLHGHSSKGQKTDDDSFRLVLLPINRTFRRRITDASGNPLSGVLVRVEYLQHDVNLGSTHWSRRKIGTERILSVEFTNNDGWYEVNLPEDSSGWLRVVHPEWASTGLRVSPDTDDHTDSTTRLEPAAKVSGLVIDSLTGQPAEGVSIGAHEIPSDMRSGGWGEAKSDADGRYLINSLAAGEYNTLLLDGAKKPLTAVAHSGVFLKSGETSKADFSLIKGRRLHGRVMDVTTGQLISNCIVSYYGAARPPTTDATLSSTTNTQGEFEMFVPPGPSHVYVAESREETNESTRDLEIVRDRDPEAIILKVGPRIEGGIRVFPGPMLDRKVSLESLDQPLFDVLKDACNQAGVSLKSDSDDNKLVEFSKNTRQTADLTLVTLEKALITILKPIPDLKFRSVENRIEIDKGI